MSTIADPTTTVQLEGFFNPYAGMGPPECCFCAPTGVPLNLGTGQPQQTPEQQQATQIAINVQVNASVQANIPGLANLAFMTKTEDAMRTLERGRIEQRQKKQLYAPGVAEMGHGPYFYSKDTDAQYIP